MIRFLRAFAWLRWRLLLNGVRSGRRRDALEQVSRLLALIVPALIVVMSLGSIILVALGGLIGGNALATGRFAAPDVIIFVARALLFGATALVVFMPIGGAAQTTGTKYSRLLLLPIPTRGLHLVEVVAGLADPWILFTLPGLALFAAGLAWGGRMDLAAIAAVAGMALAVVLASMAALVSFSVSWLFRDRRRAELLTIIAVMSISVVALLPQFLNDAESGMRRRGGARGSGPITVARIESMLPAWSNVLPSELFGGAMTSAVVDGDRRAAMNWVAVLVTEGIVFFWLSGLVHRRLLEAAGGSTSRRQRMARMRPPWRLPPVSPQAMAVAWVMVKGGLRSVRGRVAVLLPGPMMALVSLVVLRKPDEAPWIAMLGTHSHLLFGVSLFVAIFAIQPFTMNQFSSDRAGLTLQFLMPVSSVDLVRGKAIAGGALFLIAAVISGVAAAVATGGGLPVPWVMTLVGGLATYVTITPIAALMSAVFPVAADMSKAGSGGNPHTASALIGMFAGCAAILPVLIIAVPGLLPGGTPVGRLLAMTAWLAVVTAVAWLLLALISRVVTARRENLFLTK